MPGHTKIFYINGALLSQARTLDLNILAARDEAPITAFRDAEPMYGSAYLSGQLLI